MQNIKNTIQNEIYQKKMLYGSPIDLYDIVWETDRATRKKEIVSYKKAHIQKAVVEDVRLFRGFAYDLAYISANKDFTSGGLFDTNDKTVEIDKQDLPPDWSDIDLKQFITINGKRFDIKRVKDADYKYVLDVIEHKGQDVLIGLETYSVLTLDQDVENV